MRDVHAVLAVSSTVRPPWLLTADPALLEDLFRKGCTIIVDSRLENVRFLRQHLKRRYRYRQHDIVGATTF